MSTRVNTWKPFPIPNWVVSLIVGFVALYSMAFLALAEKNFYILLGMSSFLALLIVLFYAIGFLSIMGMFFMDYDNEISTCDDGKAEAIFHVVNQISIS
uniref:Transmembrane protein n=1 Tax=Strongyloides venezuelensis TaxID=75913 RepID=A0A0K0F0D1_STRVS